MNEPTTTWRSGGGQFGMVPKWILIHPELDGWSVRLYGLLAVIASFETGEASKSQAELAEALGVSIRTLQRCQAQLEAAGAVEVIENHHPQYGRGWNTYRLSWSPPYDADGVSPDVADGVGEASPMAEPIHTPALQTRDSSDIANRHDRRSALWDALEHVFGYRPTGDEAALWGRLVSRVEEREGTPDEIGRRALVWQYHYSVPLTPATLLHKWDWLGGKTANMSDDKRGKLRELAQERSDDAYWSMLERQLAGGSK